MIKEKKKKPLKREFIEWGIIIGIGATLYFTGLHTEVIGSIQRLVLVTGIIKPDLEEEPVMKANYNFNLIDREGKMINGSSLKGKVVFINFWATWCPPCIAEMPNIHNLYWEFRDDDNIIFLMISLDDDFNKALNFVDKKEFSFPIFRFASHIPQEFSSKVIPTTYVLSPGGYIKLRKEGMAKYNTESFRNFLRSL